MAMSRKWTLGLIWGSALLPLLAALVAYGFGLPVTGGSNNRGELQQPIRTLSQWGGDAERHTGRWTLLLSVDRVCDAVCEQARNQLRAVHDALGRDAARVQIDIEAGSELGLAQGVWLIDPLGNLVLRYTHQQPAQDVLTDLRKLLKVSNLG